MDINRIRKTVGCFVLVKRLTVSFQPFQSFQLKTFRNNSTASIYVSSLFWPPRVAPLSHACGTPSIRRCTTCRPPFFNFSARDSASRQSTSPSNYQIGKGVHACIGRGDAGVFFVNCRRYIATVQKPPQERWN
jgi:hypothetical protein